MNITTNELLEELRRAISADAPAEAMTVREIGTAMGLGHSAVKERLKRLRDDGRLKIWKKSITDAAGRPQIVPAYTILPRKRKS